MVLRRVFRHGVLYTLSPSQTPDKYLSGIVGRVNESPSCLQCLMRNGYCTSLLLLLVLLGFDFLNAAKLSEGSTNEGVGVGVAGDRSFLEDVLPRQRCAYRLLSQHPFLVVISLSFALSHNKIWTLSKFLSCFRLRTACRPVPINVASLCALLTLSST